MVVFVCFSLIKQVFVFASSCCWLISERRLMKITTTTVKFTPTFTWILFISGPVQLTFQSTDFFLFTFSVCLWTPLSPCLLSLTFSFTTGASSPSLSSSSLSKIWRLRLTTFLTGELVSCTPFCTLSGLFTGLQQSVHTHTQTDGEVWCGERHEVGFYLTVLWCSAAGAAFIIKSVEKSIVKKPRGKNRK